MFIFIRCFFVLTFFFIVSCVSGHCDRDGRGMRDQSNEKVFVYKYDGSKQCDQKKGTSLEEMKKEFGGKIKIYSSKKQTDGVVRVQVCGALTGKSNVYEIKKKDLPFAEALGYKKWDF